MLRPLCMTLTCVLAMAILVETSVHAQGLITLNNQTGLQVTSRFDEPMAITTAATPFAPFAILGARQHQPLMTPFGLLEVDLNDPDFIVAVDGFDSSHPYHSLGFTDSFGQSRLSFVPFDTSSTEGDTIYLQAIVHDPLAWPHHLSLTNAVGMVAAPHLPRVDSVYPRSSLLDELITIEGKYFTGRPTSNEAPIVTMNGDAVTVVSYDDECIRILAPAHVRSGSIRVKTDVGSSPDLSGHPDFYVVILGNFASETADGYGPYDGDFSIFGQLSTLTEEDTYQIYLEAGEELFVESFNADPALLIADPFDPATAGFGDVNTQIRLDIPGSPLNPIRADSDRGPGYAAAIGAAQGERFVAPFTGIFEITVSAFQSQWAGHYLLNIWTRDDDLLSPPEILGIHPNYAAAGAEVAVYATGIDYDQLGNNYVVFSSSQNPEITAPMTVLANGQHGVIVPAGVRAGCIRVVNAAGLSSADNPDHFPSFFMPDAVPTSAHLVSVISDDIQIKGSLSYLFDLDHFTLSLTAGDTVSIRAHSFDAQHHRLTNEPLFAFNQLDAELQLRRSLWGIIEATDAHSGAGIGAHITPESWTAPLTSTYSLCVHPWLFLSSGPYILDVVIN